MSARAHTDDFGRVVDYLRISVTDRCNLRCDYCMPADGVPRMDRTEILSYEDIERFVTVGISEGLVKVRLTGGEPLLRRDLASHARRLASIPGLAGLALTTNGTLLAPLAYDLASAGIERVNVSIDSLDPDHYARVTCGGILEDTLAGVDAALDAGMHPVKINVVVRGVDQDLAAFAEMTRERPLHVRFIERMAVGPEGTAHDSPDVPERLRAAGVDPLEDADDPPQGWGPARYMRLPGAQGTIGVITGESDHFCEQCTRLRLTADGHLRPCLFDAGEFDVREAVREGTDDDIALLIRQAISARPRGRCEMEGTERHMSGIGG